jgi:hypothetical protein
MKTSQDQVIKALSGLIPEDAQEKVSTAISSFIEGAVAELEEEYNSKLEETYKKVEDEKASAVKIAEEGYSTAWGIITDLRNRLEVQKEEFDHSLEEGYEEAYQMILEERAKKDSLEVDLYEEYDKRLADIKEYMVDKIDQFLQLQGEKYYEMARKDTMNDPTVVESKVAFDRILEVAADYLSDEDYAFATGSKLEQLQKSLEDTKAQIKIVEAKNIRLATENSKLNESAARNQELINENANKVGKKERVEKAKQVEGRADRMTDSKRVKLIGEQVDESVAEQKSNDQGVLIEQLGEKIQKDMIHLSGLSKSDE